MSNTKISIRFFNDREVRAIWDEENSKWWFSVLDIVSVLTNQNEYTKTRNYWKYLKAKLKKEKSELVSVTTQLKLLASDGKRYLTDMLDYNGIIALGKEFPGKIDKHFHRLEISFFLCCWCRPPLANFNTNSGRELELKKCNSPQQKKAVIKS